MSHCWNVQSQTITLVLSTSPTPESHYLHWEGELRGQQWLFLSLYARPADLEHWSNQKENWLDGEDLSAMFFPVSLVAREQSSLICTIQASYATVILSYQRPQLLSPSRLQVRPDNVFYRTPNRYSGLRRARSSSFTSAHRISAFGDSVGSKDLASYSRRMYREVRNDAHPEASGSQKIAEHTECKR